MNSKIYEITKYQNSLKTDTLITFGQDEYGSWENVSTGRSGYSGIRDHTMFSRYLLNNGIYSGTISSERTIENLRKANEISFTMETHRKQNSVWYWNGGWTAKFDILDSFIEISSNASSYGVKVNGYSIPVTLSENVTYNFTFKQRYVVIDGIRYDYSDDTRLRDALSDYCYIRCAQGSVSAGGYACDAYLYLTVSDISVTW